MPARRARHCALASRCCEGVGGGEGGRVSKVEKSQHSVSGARVRSAYVAAKEEVGGGVVAVGDGVGDVDGDGGKVAIMRAEGEEVWNWRRRRRGREKGRWGRRWGASVARGLGWMYVCGWMVVVMMGEGRKRRGHVLGQGLLVIG